ncbi:MAG: alpha-ketoacid dehydrogenase subunit beta [Victivallaceae bacterium]|nr:alpha-ketoacid dehydrogenase subunit beta [Victivallaceae bacterium]
MRKITYIDAMNEALHEEMQRDENVFVIGEDVDIDGGVWNECYKLMETFGKQRVVGTPISESAFSGLAAGAAMCGLRPVLEFMYMDFVGVAMDQLCNQIAKLHIMSGGQVKIPVTIRMCGTGTGSREAAQHSQSLEAWFAHIPGFKVVMPATAKDSKGLLKAAIRDDSPVIFIENRNLYYEKEPVPEGEFIVPIGQGEIVREGTDVTVVAVAYSRHKVLKALEMTEASVELIDPRTVDPLDMPLILDSLAKTGKLLVVQEATSECGIGAEIVRQVVEKGFDYLDCPPVVLGGKNIPTPFSAPLEDHVLPQVEDIAEKITAFAKYQI